MMEIVKYDARLTILIWITIVFLLNVLMFVVVYGPILSYRRDSEYSLSMFLSANIIIWPYAIVGMIVIKMLMTSVRRSICSLIGYPVGLIYVKNFVDFYHPWDESLSKDIGKLLQ